MSTTSKGNPKYRKGPKHVENVRSDDSSTHKTLNISENLEKFRGIVKNVGDEERSLLEAEVLASMPSTINDGTAESYVYGCLSESTDSADACIPSCINGYKFKGMKSCSNRTYSKKEGVLKLINKIKTDKAYVYLEEGNELSRSDMKMLRNKHRIREVYIYMRKSGSRGYDHVRTTELVSKKTHVDKTKKGTNGVAAVVGFLLLILIILLIIYLLYNMDCGSLLA